MRTWFHGFGIDLNYSTSRYDYKHCCFLKQTTETKVQTKDGTIPSSGIGINAFSSLTESELNFSAGIGIWNRPIPVYSN